MSEPADDLAKTVEFTTDAWLMGKVPWALWASVLGLIIALHTNDRGEDGAGVALVYTAALGLLFAGFVAVEKISRSNFPFLITLVVGTAGVIVTAAVIGTMLALIGEKVGSGYPGLPWHRRLLDPKLHVLGWMMIYLGGLWIAGALYRHAYPARSMLMLSPAGVAYHRFWLRDLLIPWHEIQDVGMVSTTDGWGRSTPYSVFIVIDRTVFERRIKPRLSSLAPPGAEKLVVEKEEGMAMALSAPELSSGLEQMHAALKARWDAFRDKLTSAPQPGVSVGPSIVYGRWSIDGSLRQAISFAAPLVAMAAVLLHWAFLN